MPESNDNILTKTYDLIKGIVPLINTFPRNQRYILGEHLEKMALETLELFIEAYYLPKEHKRSKLHRVNLQLEKLRYLIRLCYELGFYNSTKMAQLSQQLLEIGRMTGGWIKSLEK